VLTKVNAYIDYLLAIRSLNKRRYSKYFKLYPFTTENIKGYMQDLKLENKKVLTVTGSFDHSLNAILLGCRDLVNFDINKLSYYMAELKIAALKELSLNEFLSFFNIDNSNALDYKIFEKMKYRLNIKVLTFFELMYKKNYMHDLFIHKYKINLDLNIYLTQDNYLKLKDVINEVKITFITSNIINLHKKTNEKFDYIFSSNISDYLKNIYHRDYLSRFSLFIQNKLSKLLKKDGTLMCAYIYDYKLNKSNPRTDIDDHEKRELYFKKEKFSIKKFNSVISPLAKDAVIIYRR
jgi:S-adenosylmethionine:diacylglycerol 3-amino-3-carboxypropyl transferase